MEDFRKLFFDEAKDLLSKLEETLLELEGDFGNKEYINEVFRIMHSLKGSGAMFGFTNLSGFTHNLETLYDKIRSGSIDLSPDLITFTMKCGDHIAQLLESDNNEDLVETTKELKEYITSLLEEKTDDDDSVTDSPDSDDKLSTSTPISANKKVFFIKFEPNEDILGDGTNPLYLVDELVDLGDSIVKLNHQNLPDFDEINPELCYLSWTIILSTESDINDLNDVFIFVEDDSKIEIELISELDIFSLNNAKSTFKYGLDTKPHECSEFKKIAKTLEISIIQPHTTDIDETELKTDGAPIIEEELNIDKPVTKKKAEISIPESIHIDTVKVSSTKLDSLINLVSELVTTQARLVTLANNTKSNELIGLSEDFQYLSRQFRDIAFDMRLIPIHTLVVKFKRLVRDLSNNLGKKVVFTTEGTETELDKNIISTLSDPIMHIIRNAIDHGIELPDDRIKNNKDATGIIHLKAEYSGTSIIIQINDDGAGINKDIVLKKALKKNLIQPGDDLSNEEIYNLLMLPGFSTSEVVTDVSGRGVGMDVVRKKITDLRGEVNITSEPGKGTSVIIKLPLTLSIIDGLLVSINSERFVIPMSSVKQIYQVSKDDIQNSFNSIIDIEGVQFPFINLPEKFENTSGTSDVLHFITVGFHNKTVGLIVNELISEYQAVLKPIGKMLSNNEIFAGASILGDGKVALVLDSNKLIDYYSNLKTNSHDK